MPSACIMFSVGCPRSQVEIAKLFPYFAANGWTLAPASEAEMVIVATCGVDVSSENTSRNYLRAVDAKRKKGSRLVVLGCLAGIDEEALSAQFDAAIIPPVHIELLDDLIQAKVPLRDIDDPGRVQPLIKEARNNLPFAPHFSDGPLKAGARRVFDETGLRRILMTAGLWTHRTPPLEPVDDVYTVRVAAGCLGECAYCAIRRACGPLVSKPLEKVLHEFDAGIEAGYREFKIIAQDIGAYGQDIGSNEVELIRALMAREGDFRLTLLDIGPQWFVQDADALIPIFAANAHKVRLIMMPIQSGSSRILEMMRRRYTAEEAADRIGALRKAAPGLTLATHIMVGFPGETEDDFQQTVQFLRKVRFDRVDVYEYGDRPHTEASQMPGKVSLRLCQQRMSRLTKEFRAAPSQ